MSSLFRNAFSYIGANGNGIVTDEDALIGREVEVLGYKLRIKKVIAEGGFAIVYVAQDCSSGLGNYYALKRLIATDKATSDAIQKEIEICRKLSGHPHIMGFVASSVNEIGGRKEYFLVTELCNGGSLIDAMRELEGSSFSVEQICAIVYQLSKCVQHMQAQTPPIIHRDLKVENLLFGSDLTMKLCDFGSATAESYYFDSGWAANRRGLVEEEMAAHTTPMYRAPEMLDTWNNYPITYQADIWAFGCILYYLCYMKHPFEDSAKLRILNGNYTIPSLDNRYECFHPIIKGCLIVDPSQRFKIEDILGRLAAIGESKNISLKGPINLPLKKINISTPVHTPNRPTASPRTAPPPPQKAPDGSTSPGPPQRPPRTNAPSRPLPPVPQQNMVNSSTGGLFSSIKGYSGSIFKNIKDTSSKVIQTVSQSMTRTDLDLTYITSRIIAMSYPAEGLESTYRNHVDDVKAVLDGRHLGHYVIYNVSGRQYNQTKFNAKIVEANWSATRAATLAAIYNISCSMYDYLSRDEQNVVVVHCMDGKASTAMLISSFLLLAGSFSKPEEPLNMFAIKRCLPGLQPSQFRYLNYTTSLINSEFPHFKPATLTSLKLSPIPLFTQKRDGIRPYVEIWQGDHKVLSTLHEYESMRMFTPNENMAAIPLNVHVVGDVCIYIYHARRMVSKVVGVKIAQIQFHTGFVPEEETKLIFKMSELDDICDPERYPPNFIVHVGVLFSDTERSPPKPPPWVARPSSGFEALVPFANLLEMEETREKFVPKIGDASTLPEPSLNNVDETPRESFPENLDWRANEPRLIESQSDSDEEIVQMQHPAQRTHDPPSRPPPPPQPDNKPEIIPDIDLLNIGGDVSNTQNAPTPDLFNVQPTSRNAPNNLFDLPAPPDIDILNMGPKNDLSNFDLLTDINTQSAVKDTKVTGGQEDLFGSFVAASSEFPKAPDLLGQFSVPIASNLPGVNSASVNASPQHLPSPQQQMVPPQQNNKPSDPFADLGLGGWATSSSKSTTPIRGTTPVSSSPQHQAWTGQMGGISGGQMPPMGGGYRPPVVSVGGMQSQYPMSGGNVPQSATMGWQQPGGFPGQPQAAQVKSPMGTPQHHAKSPMQSNYSRTNFDTTGNQKSTDPGNLFGNLLGSQGFNFTPKESAPKTMGAMKKEELIKDMDPEKIKLLEWTDGKKNNIRALLCSLSTVLWDGAKWKDCGMHQLVHHSDVKKMYRRACLAVHPDKHAGTEHEALAKLLFMELNEAYSEFEDDPSQKQL